ncbi:MAG: tetratricopeptide repeat protein [Sphingobacteriaceae bacterium]|nr:MAG: tetratricopeptide repeat protein [Sphingobacteriaceae bacterium]
MKPVLKHLLTITACAFCLPGFAQDTRTLIKEGIELNNAKQYTTAIEKYKAALALEPDNTTANYQIAFSMNSAGMGYEAIPYLQKVVSADASPTIVSSAYSLMGSIYDKSAQPKQAIDSYLQAIKLDTTNHLLHYNLALAYFRAKQYNEAEKSVLKMLAAEPKHPGSVRLYALVTFHQDKRAVALLALCRFLSIEPKGPSSAEAYGNLQSILKGGSLKAEPGVKPPLADAANQALNQVITLAVNTVDKRKYTSPATLLAKQLNAIFTQLGPIAEKQANTSPFFKGLASHYYQLAQNERMIAFANFISQSTNKSAAAWVKAHANQVSGEW